MAAPEIPVPADSTLRALEPSFWQWTATLVSLAALAGSLYLTIGMGLKACPLCYYQRTFVMAVVAILVAGLFIKDLRPSVATLLSLPLAVAALAVAGYHEYLAQTGALECPHGLLGVGTAPEQSLAVLALLTILLIADQLRQQALTAIFASVVLGGLLAFSGIMSVGRGACPDYNLPLDEDMCRKPKQS